jgi:di/tricarboxylate transporter
MLTATVVLLVLDVIQVEEAFAGFSNAAPITVAALFVVARAVHHTGLLAVPATYLLGEADRPGALARLVVPAAGLSACLNNTPMVAVMIPQVLTWAKRHDIPVSRFLLPLSYATILGGTLTVLGTSTNLVVSGLLEREGQAPLGIFEITVIGGPVVVAGLAVLLGVVPRLLRGRRTVLEETSENFREFSVQMQVVPGGFADGRTVAAAGLRELGGAFLVAIEREGEVTVATTPETVLVGGDLLTFVGPSQDVIELQRSRGLRSAEEKHLLSVESPGHAFYEAVVSGASPLVGRTLKQAGFRSRYQAAVVAIHRSGHRLQGRMGQRVIHEGDTLVILAAPGFARRWRESRDFLLIARVGGPPPSASRKAPVVGFVVLAMVLSAAFGLVPVVEAALLAAGALVATRVLTLSEARESVDMSVLVLIGAAFGLGAAISSTGLAEQAAAVCVQALGGLGDVGVVLGLVLVTMFLTELVTNNAAAVIVFPVAASVSAATGLDLRVLVMAVAVAASCSFLTPIGYQTNTMVYGPGGYRFTDYLRAGLPLSLGSAAVITVMGTLLAG